MKITACISLRDAAVQGERRAGVAGRGAGGPLGADRAGVREGGRHAVVFEAARGVHPLVLQEQPAGVQADVLGDAVGVLQQRLAFADGDDLVGRGERQQLVEPPDAAEGRAARCGAAHFASNQRSDSGGGSAVPVVGHVEQRAALGAGGVDLAHVEGGAAVGRQALLIGLVGIDFDRSCHVRMTPRRAAASG